MPYHSGDQFRRSMHKDIIMASTGDVGRQTKYRFASIYDTVLASRYPTPLLRRVQGNRLCRIAVWVVTHRQV